MSTGPLDYLIIGAGPAGLQLAQQLDAAGRDYLVLESGTAPGTFFTRFPRHRKLISINKPHTGTDDPEVSMRVDWNSLLSTDGNGPLFTRYSTDFFPAAGDYLRYLSDYAERYSPRIDYETTVTRVSRPAPAGDPGDRAAAGRANFVVADSRGREHQARRVVVATGVTKPYVPSIPGIELAEQYGTVTVDPEDFADQRVLILGKANSALETAENLIATAAVIHVAGPDSVRMAWRTHYVGHLRAVNSGFLDTYQLKLGNAVLDGTVLSIERDPEDGMLVVQFSFTRANEFVKELRYDRIICCTGFRFDASIFDEDCRPSLVHKDRFPRITSAYESADVPDLYFAGTITQTVDFKRGTSGFIHGFRYGVRALGKVLGQRYHQDPWPSVAVPGTPEAIAEAILARVNRTSGLFQQFATLADVVIRPPRADASYLEEVPVRYALDGGLGDVAGDADLLVVTLEYGPDHDKVDPFDVTVARVAQDDAEHAFDASYLHPVIRLYSGGELVATHHVAENLENQWDKPAHRDPLIAFLRAHNPARDPVHDQADDQAPATAGGR